MKNLVALAVVTMIGGAGCGGGADGTSSNAEAERSRPVDLTVSAPVWAGPSDRYASVTQVLIRTDLVGDREGDAAITDPNLVNAWGLAFNPNNGGLWVAANHSGAALVYKSDGANHVAVTVPASTGGAIASPTGVVYNGDGLAFGGDTFVIATEDGTIAGWHRLTGTSAEVRVDNSSKGTVYKGLAIAHADGQARLYAADFHHGRVDVFDAAYHPIVVAGGFADPTMPEGFAPFNVVAFNDVVVVSYAKQALPDRRDDAPGAGNGFVNVFDPEGRLFQRLLSGGTLNSPWGMVITPPDFGWIPNRLLVGNFGDGRINVYKVGALGRFLNAELEGPIADARHRPIVIDGLWALAFGTGNRGYRSDQLYFTAGPGGEDHGVLGRLELP